jgi:hypothetical protein
VRTVQICAARFNIEGIPWFAQAFKGHVREYEGEFRGEYENYGNTRIKENTEENTKIENQAFFTHQARCCWGLKI